MFDWSGVNSLSAFRTKFFAYELRPDSKPYTSASTTPRASWDTQRKAGEQYVGQLSGGGRRHGMGVLLQPGASAPIIYSGHFQDGLRNGYGAIFTPRGETFHGFFKDDVLWGPGVYTFPRPSGPSPPPRHRVRFEGMHNGRPAGKGQLIWSDGTREDGEFQGAELVRALAADDCAGVLLVAQSNAELAKRVVAEVEDEMRRQGLWDGHASELWAAARAQV